MLIKEQIRKYKIKMDEISQLEAAESIAFRRLSLLRQNTVSSEINHRTSPSSRRHLTNSVRGCPANFSHPSHSVSQDQLADERKRDLGLPRIIGRK